MGDKIFWVGTEDALEYVSSTDIFMLFQESFTQEPICFDVARMLTQDMFAMGYCFCQPIVVYELVYLFEISLQSNLSHAGFRVLLVSAGWLWVMKSVLPMTVNQ